MYARTGEDTGQDLQGAAWVAGHSKTAKDVRLASVLLSCPTHPLANHAPTRQFETPQHAPKSLPKGKHAAEHNAAPAPLMMEHAWLRSATTKHWHQDTSK